jgi:hypothetical protein
MNTQTEQWKAVAECNGEYHISNFGRLKSLKFNKERILKQVLSPYGYPSVNLSFKGKMIMKPIHRLVCLAFVENPYNKPQVNHKDGNKLNNNFDNLEWMTSKENNQHAWDNGLNGRKHI